jgi:D-methionine transport system substrate-binding protein
VLLNLIREDLAARNIELKVVEYNDYVQPNEALIAGDLDANFFQHIPYLEENERWSQALVSVFGVHIEPFGIYANSLRDLNALPQNAVIAIPNDPTNEGRALLLLASGGLITLREGVGLNATPRDITVNPKNLQFRELAAELLPRALGDVAAAAINGNYALSAGLNPVRDALLIEGAESPYVNIIVARRGTETDARFLALKEALLSARVRDYILSTYTDGSVVPVF